MLALKSRSIRPALSTKWLFASPIAALVLVAGQAAAKIPAALDRVPKNAVLVIATDNFEQTTKRIKAFADKLHAEDTEDLDEFVEHVNGTEGFKKNGSIALVVMPEKDGANAAKAEKDISKDGDDDGAARHRADDPMDRAVVIAQVSDYKKMVEGLGGDPAAKVAKVEGLGEEPMFVRDIGSGWVVMGPKEEPVTSFEPGEKMLKQHQETLGVVGNRAAESSDVILIANWEALSAKFGEKIEDVSKQAKKSLKRGNPAFGPIPPEAVGKFFAPVEKVMRAYNRDAQTCVAGIGLGEDGLSFDVGAQFKPKSEIAGFFQSTGKADATLSKLPNTPFLAALSLDTSNPGVRQMVRNTSEIADSMLASAKEEAKRQAADADKASGKQLDTAITMFESRTAGLRNLAKSIDKMDGMDVVWGYSPAVLAGAGLFSGMIYEVRGSDPAALKSLVVEQFKATEKMEGPMKMESTFTPNAAEVGGAKLDSWTLKPKMDPNDPAASQMAMVNMFIFGATGQMSGNIATTKDAVIVTYSPNTQIMQTALDATGGKATIGSYAGATAAVKPLPSGSWMRGLIGTKSLFDLGQMALSFTGQPIQLKVPADVPPMAWGVTGDGGGMHVRFHVPAQVVSTIGDVIQQFRDATEGHEDGDQEMKEEKPRF